MISLVVCGFRARVLRLRKYFGIVLTINAYEASRLCFESLTLSKKAVTKFSKSY